MICVSFKPLINLALENTLSCDKCSFYSRLSYTTTRRCFSYLNYSFYNNILIIVAADTTLEKPSNLFVISFRFF